jgi:hypothetical protein
MGRAGEYTRINDQFKELSHSTVLHDGQEVADGAANRVFDVIRTRMPRMTAVAGHVAPQQPSSSSRAETSVGPVRADGTTESEAPHVSRDPDDDSDDEGDMSRYYTADGPGRRGAKKPAPQKHAAPAKPAASNTKAWWPF